MSQIKVALIVFNDVELLDFAAPLEILSVATILPSCSTTSRSPDLRPKAFDVSILSETPTFKTANGKGYTMTRDVDIFSPAGDPANWDVIIVPGGPGSRVQMRNEKLLGWIRSFARANIDMPGEKRKVILSVCTGSLILATAGILDGMKVTTHHDARALIKTLVEEHGSEIEVVVDRVVEGALKKDGEDLGVDVVTSGGVSSGIDASFYLVRRLVGVECANNTAVYVEYDWKDIY